MRIIIPLLVISLLSCSRNEIAQTNISADLRLISERSNPSQNFDIDPKIDTTITGREGTKLFIKAGSFVDQYNQPVHSKISISMKEVYSVSEMIFNGLSTLSNGMLLETSGMIQVIATSEGKELRLTKSSPIRIQFKKIIDNPSMRTFLGKQDSIRINWVIDENNVLDTIIYTEPTEMIVPLDYGADSVITVDVTYGIVGTDTIKLRQSIDDVLIELDTSLYVYEPPFYQIHSTELNWINCDYFIYSEDLINVEIAKLENAETINYLVFEEINSIMDSWEYHESKTVFRNIPRDSKVKVISIVKDESGYLLSIEDRILKQNNQKITLVYQNSNLEEISKQIKLLN